MDLNQMLMEFLAKFPVMSTVMVVVLVLRAVMQPLSDLVHAYVKATPSPKDDASVEKIEASKAYKAVMYVVQWLSGVKLPK